MFNVQQKNKIKARAVLGLPLTAKERAYFLLFLASMQEVNDFLTREKQNNKGVL